MGKNKRLSLSSVEVQEIKNKTVKNSAVNRNRARKKKKKQWR